MLETVSFWENPVHTERRMFVHSHIPTKISKAIVFLNPIFDEKKRVQRFQSLLGRALALDHTIVYRFDYYGTGDSSGDFHDFTIQETLVDLDLFCRHLQDQHGLSHLQVLGLRFGADIGMLLASRCPAVNALWLIEPLVFGTRFLKEQRIRRQLHDRMHRVSNESHRVELDGRSFEDHLGFLLSDNCVSEIESLNPDRYDFQGRWIFLLKLTSTGMGALRRLAKHLGARNQVVQREFESPDFWARLEPIDTAPLIEWLRSFVQGNQCRV